MATTKKTTTKKSGVSPVAKKVTIKPATKKKAIKAVSIKKTGSIKSLIKNGTKHFVSIFEGMNMIAAFQDNINEGKIDKKIFTPGREFDITLFQAILSLDGVKKIRFKNALTSEGVHTLVVTGVDASGHDLYLPSTFNPNKINDSSSRSILPQEGVGDMGDLCTDPIKYPKKQD